MRIEQPDAVYAERLSLLHAALSESPAGSDLLISAFLAALQHFKRASIATPFPQELFSDVQTGEKDPDACLRAAEALPPLSQLLVAGGGTAPGGGMGRASALLACLPSATRHLLEWLVIPSSRRRVCFRQVRTRCYFCTVYTVQNTTSYLDVAS